MATCDQLFADFRRLVAEDAQAWEDLLLAGREHGRQSLQHEDADQDHMAAHDAMIAFAVVHGEDLTAHLGAVTEAIKERRAVEGDDDRAPSYGWGA
ncbi:hypothetical protein GTQ99_00660 [Kineococcus sp. T13]|uniref:hypothetical protein n=1 Tax=Kineococcus vitellinus TaxID=2696565 RepID=UPI001411B6BB|nr:hypothetical protein [Kineococcus vitellinus]NAZ73943.1 hypothetical protein [Kineococcus vitellinus]